MSYFVLGRHEIVGAPLTVRNRAAADLGESGSSTCHLASRRKCEMAHSRL